MTFGTDMDQRILVIGYGNVYCRDDGVAYHVINLLRQFLGQPMLEPDDDGIDTLGHAFDTVVLHQLVPEVVTLLPKYQHIFFIDAHQGIIPDEVRVAEVREEMAFHAVTHHMSPGMLLALTRQQAQFAPSAHLISIRGDDFDFGLGLSASCANRVRVAVDKILDLARSYITRPTRMDA